MDIKTIPFSQREANLNVEVKPSALERADDDSALPTAPLRNPFPNTDPYVIIRGRTRPLLMLIAGLMFTPVGVALSVPFISDLWTGSLSWRSFTVGLPLLVLGVVFLLVVVALFLDLFNYLRFGKGPPVLVLSPMGIVDYRTVPPLNIPWQAIWDVDVLLHSDDREVHEAQVLLHLHGRQQGYAISLVGLDMGVWEFKDQIRRRVTLASDARRAFPSAQRELGVLLASFPNCQVPVLGLFVVLLLVSVGVVIVQLDNNATPTSLLGGISVTLLCAANLAHVLYFARDAIRVYENGLIVRGQFFSKIYWFTDLAGGLLLLRDGTPDSMILKFRDGKKRYLDTTTKRLRELCKLINQRT